MHTSNSTFAPSAEGVNNATSKPTESVGQPSPWTEERRAARRKKIARAAEASVLHAMLGLARIAYADGVNWAVDATGDGEQAVACSAALLAFMETLADLERLDRYVHDLGDLGPSILAEDVREVEL